MWVRISQTILIVVAVVAVLAFAVVLLFMEGPYLFRSVTTTGTVTAVSVNVMEGSGGGGESGNTVWTYNQRIQYQFKDEEGTEHWGETSSISASPPAYRSGDSIQVQYLTGTPQNN